MTRSGTLAKAALSVVLLSTSWVSAEPTSEQRATAEALFQQATALVDGGHFAEACEKFSASQELDPGLGTLLYLADCYDRAGRSASAWALFREVEERSHRDNQPDRERIAHERGSALDGKLSRLELRVPASRQVPGLELYLRGAVVPKASWNVALPVDPGSVRVEARAPGKKPWSTRLSIESGPSSQTVELPELAPAPASAEPRVQRLERDDGADSTMQRSAGLLVGGVGLIALGASGFFGYRAYTRNKSSKGECLAGSPNACSPRGASLREQATTDAKLSTIAAVCGVAFVAGGATLVISAPSPLRDTRAAAAPWQLELQGAF
jgi:hypothetical protein